MTVALNPDESSRAWETDVRVREEALRLAFLSANIAALEELLAEGYVVNSPLQTVLDKRRLLELVRGGRIRHEAFEVEIEQLARLGEVVVVMGRDRVVDPPDGIVSHRRFTNVWSRIDGTWRSIARHAHVVSREPVPGPRPP